VFSITLTAFPYTLHFKRPAQTSRGLLSSREVVFLRAERDGVAGWGECGPVPGLSRDERPDYLAVVGDLCAQINRGEELAEAELDALPSFAFGLETALRDLATGGRQRLFDAPFTRGEAAQTTHGLIWTDTADGMLRQVEDKVEQGCRVIKMKVGGLRFADELHLLGAFRRRLPAPACELRLDANGAWPSVELALARLHDLARFEPAFVEQPLPPGFSSTTAEVCAKSPVPIALDEELISVGHADERRSLLRSLRPQHLILKPSLLGGLAACQAWIADAEALGIQWWINSLLESNVGLNAIVQWTAAHGSDRVHGLGTGQLFANNIPSPLRLDGCGLRLDGAVWDFSLLDV
jgi:o-succinylbenzoate synthase